MGYKYIANFVCFVCLNQNVAHAHKFIDAYRFQHERKVAVNNERNQTGTFRLHWRFGQRVKGQADNYQRNERPRSFACFAAAECSRFGCDAFCESEFVKMGFAKIREAF